MLWLLLADGYEIVIKITLHFRDIRIKDYTFHEYI